MKRAFLDTNIILDFVTQRQGYEEACDILQLGEDNRAFLCVSILSMANTAYVARRGRTQDELYGVMNGLAELFDILKMDESQLKEALTINATDFEDVLQYICAISNNCDVIVTRNIKHFNFSKMPVLTPLEFIQQAR